MFYLVYSIYDNVSKQSILITMHHTNEEAKREFDNILSNEHVASRKSDLELICIGEFNPSTLEFRPVCKEPNCEVVN